MKEFKNLLFENQDGLGILTMNRPAALNALNKETMDELCELLTAIKNDPSIKAVILTGAEKSFVAGADIKEMLPMTAAEGQAWGRLGQTVFNMIENLPQPVIAAINGFALGGGCELAMACDYIFASENASFGQPEVALGLIPGFGGTVRLTQYVGIAAARELIITGRRIDSAEALRLGLALRVLPDVAAVRAAARESLGLAAAQSPAAVASAKQTTRAVRPLSTDDGLAFEAEAFAARFGTPDMLEGTAAFLEKRRAEFLGL